MIELIIVTPEGEALRESVESVVLPGSEGDFGVLGGHERFLSPLRAGAIEIRSAGGRRYASISGGFADVGPSEAAVLADACELAEEIDVARAEAARDRARAGLADSDADETPVARDDHTAALARAEARLDVARRR